MAWSWGAGSQGQLGLGSLDDALVPQPVQALGRVLDMACGGAHVAAVLGEGVTTWGRGRIGHGDDDVAEIVALPKLVKSLVGYKICHVAAGWNHTAFVAESGELFTCGDGAFGQLGHGDFVTRTSPCKVLSLASLRTSMVACGMRHTLVLGDQGVLTEETDIRRVAGGIEGSVVMSFGSSKRGQLGTCSSKQLKRVCSPQRIPSLDGCNISAVAANGDHSAALSGNGKLYLWGKVYDDSPDVPEPYIADEDLVFRMIALGWSHGLGLTEDGEVLSWGSSRYGQLGIPQDWKRAEWMHKVETLGNNKAIWVSSGAEHSAVVLGTGDVMTWGWGEHGQLGLGHTGDEHLPQKVHLGNDKFARVYCGSGFTFALSQNTI